MKGVLAAVTKRVLEATDPQEKSQLKVVAKRLAKGSPAPWNIANAALPGSQSPTLSTASLYEEAANHLEIYYVD
jgi:hypothetical protein